VAKHTISTNAMGNGILTTTAIPASQCRYTSAYSQHPWDRGAQDRCCRICTLRQSLTSCYGMEFPFTDDLHVKLYGDLQRWRQFTIYRVTV
jgi:hypothetical protein